VTAAALTPRLLHGLGDLEQRLLRVDGTAVVVDISGFTTLSEQLAAAGREGTEQLIATLSRIFTVLLPATDDGGDVVKFAGDALFVLFTGADHARHAAHAAWNMNRVLAAVGDIHLPLARTRLRMSVGVHAGVFAFFLTGAGSLSVVLTGRDTGRVLELQSAAQPGQILVSDETAAMLPASLVAGEESAPGARRLVKGGSVAAASLLSLHAGRGEAAEHFVPRAFAQRPDLLGAEPDHRWAAIAFVQVSGVPDDPDAADLARMDRLTRLVDDACADTGATLLDVDPAPDGYRYFLTAGAPTTLEDPEGRLVTAALRIVNEGAGDYAVRAGVTSGRVFAGFVGAMYRQTYTVMGDPTNLAARLAARAQPGTVLVAHSVLERTARPFAADDAGVMAVKGKTVEIPVAVVTSTEGAAELADRSAPFIGRTEELARLRGLLAAASTGDGAVVTVSGPAGVGKSRLVEHAVAETPLPVLRTRGDRYGATSPFRTLQALLRPLLDVPATATAAEAGAVLVDVVAQRAAHLLPWLALAAPAVRADVPVSDEVEALDDAYRGERATAVVRELVELLTEGPGCLVIDDAQWVDPASAAVLAELLQADATHAVLVVRRDAPGGLAPAGDGLTVPGLDDTDAADLVEAVAGRRLLPADLRPLVRRGEGNPLYLIQLAAGLASDADALGIEQLVGERIDALSESDRATLRRAAVLGVRIPLGLYMKVVGSPLIPSALGEFLELGPDGVSFRSELFRDVAYGQLAFQSRRELHRAAASTIEADPSIGGAARDAMLTAHYEAAEDWPAVREVAARAAATAEKAFALEESVHAYRIAVEAARRTGGTDDDLPELLEALGRVSIAGGWAAEGLEAFSAARKLIRDAVERARLDRERAYALNVLGRPDEAVRTLRTARRALGGVGERGEPVLGAVCVTEAGLRLRQGRWADARALALEAIGHLEGRAVDATAQRVLADAYRYHDIAASELEGDGGMIYLPLALEMYDRAGDALSRAKVLSLLGVRAYYRGDWVTAATLYDQSRQAADAAGDVVGSAIEAANTAEILLDQGRLADARPLLRDARRVFEASENPYLTAFAAALFGRAELRAGDTAAAIRELSAAADGYTTVDEPDSNADARVRLAEAQLTAGDTDAARTTLAGFEGAALSSPTRSRLLRQRARLAAADGDAALARTFAAEAVAAAGATVLERALSLALAAHLAGASDSLPAEALELVRGLGVTDPETLLTADAAVSGLEHTS
jgi:class 3 adenylate cyclase/tetratricopeptide (TPR) repeat protein